MERVRHAIGIVVIEIILSAVFVGMVIAMAAA